MSKQTPSNGSGINIRDRTLVHSWFIEDGRWRDVLTSDGVENIAGHKYRSGGYTHLDDFLDSSWLYLTNLLPLWLAPNMVTVLGFVHCLAAYVLVWHHSPNLDQAVPDYVLIVCGWCYIAYYTLDCMDGKQSRRTGTSSPLGQLFDHGVDCLCNLSHVSVIATFLTNGGTLWHFGIMSSLQFCFFCAQWEEYYTHVLPHGVGKWLGVTEVNYGLGLTTMAMAFVDREAWWVATTVGDLWRWGEILMLPEAVLSLSMGQVGVLGWLVLSVGLVALCLGRVDTYLRLHEYSVSVRFSALSKLFSPFLLALTPFVLPSEVIQTQTRQVALAMGIVFSLITKKMIVYSMAKMSFATLQIEIMPYLLCVWYICTSDNSAVKANALTYMCWWHLLCLLAWCRGAIVQITERLDIYCFTIKKKKE